MTTVTTRAPGLAPGVEVHEPMAAGAPWVVRRVDGGYLRVGADVGRLLRTLDGRQDAGALAATLGPPWTEPDVDGVLRRLAPLSVLAGPPAGGPRHRRAPVRTRPRRIRFVPPLTVQLTLVHPDRLLRRLSPLIDALARRSSLIAATVVVAGGLLALAGQAPALGAAIGGPQPMAVLIAVAIGSLLTTGLHEFGHGMALSHYGGRPTRMGMMLFYLTPVFFCDVSDGWRLPRNRQRTRVALAGIATQLLVAGAAGIAAGAVAAAGSPTGQAALLLFSVATFIAALVNLVPFVKFDGYIALMCHLDVPHLRDRSMQDARSWLARVLFGAAARRSLPDLPWAVPFGLAGMVFPAYLVLTALVLWMDLLQLAGWAGVVALTALLGYLAYRAGRGLVGLVSAARAAGAGMTRITLVLTAVAGAVAGALVLVPVPGSVTGGFVADGRTVRLVLPDTVDPAAIEAGDPVELVERGLLTRRGVGQAVVADGPTEPTLAPLLAFFPIADADDLLVDASGRTLTVTREPSVPVGQAVIATGDVPLGRWVWNQWVAPVLR
ncbi:daptide biosynthesis intramembrane metalloprotease [Nakamurella sp.]|uniref:daptide biosynthesis intramembrane metalloprotease n=1 Tax=Nakamurella sp. TaxID=1869182 RepID=UPI003B3A8D92